MKNSFKIFGMAAVLVAGCLFTATEASAHSSGRNRYERREGRRNQGRWQQQQQRGRGYGRRARQNRTRDGIWAPGIPPHQVDMDSDGIPNLRDRDQDGDGVPNHRDAFPRDERRR